MLDDAARAIAQLGDPALLAVALKALVFAVLLLAGVGIALGLYLGALLPEVLVLPILGAVPLDFGWLSAAGLVLMLIGSVFLMMPIAAVLVGFFADDVADAVERRHYPGLPPPRRPGFAQTLGETVRFTGLVILINAICLVLLLVTGPLGPFLFWGANAALLSREYFHLVAVRRMPVPAARALRRRHAGSLWVTGLLVAALLTVPVLNLLVPILGVAVFTHRFHAYAERG
ncbi:MAG: EI24 domain-containing protein [Pseudomonadota bacterium]